MNARIITAIISAFTHAHVFAAAGEIDPDFGEAGSVVVGADLASPFTDQLIDTITAPNGNIYLIGNARAGSGQTVVVVRRLHADGKPDEQYGSPGWQNGIVVLSGASGGYPILTPAAAILDGKGRLTIAATGIRSNGTLNTILCQLNDQGQPSSLPESAQVGAGCIDGIAAEEPQKFTNPQADSLALDPQKRIVVLSTGSVNGKKVLVINRRAADAFESMDLTFQSNSLIVEPISHLIGQDIDIQSTGKIIVGATAVPFASNNRDFFIARLNSSGVLDNSFNGSGIRTIAFEQGGDRSDSLKSIAILADDSIVLAGNSRIDMKSVQFSAAKLTPNGGTHFGFGAGGKIVHVFCDVCLQATLADMAIQADGKIVLVGTAQGDFFEDFGVMRLLANGSIDNAFGAEGRVFIGFDTMDGDNVGGPAKSIGASVSLQNGNIIVGGTTQIDANNLSNRDYATVRLLAN